MHVDGAYSCFRAANPGCLTVAVRLGYQRRSRSDIAQNAWFDRVPIIRMAVSIARSLMDRTTLKGNAREAKHQ